MKLLIHAASAAVLVALLVAGPLTRVASAQGIKTGVLTCQVAAGFGWIVGSTRTMDCKFLPGQGHSEEYTGTLSQNRT